MIMNPSYPLDAMICEVSRGTQPASDVERLIIIDVDSQRSVDKKRFLREVKYFIVSTEKSAEWRTPFIHFKDFENDRSVGIQVSYLAACEPGQERRVAEALFNGPHPAAVLNEKIKRWLKEYASLRQAEFIDNFFALQPQIQAYIKSKAHEEIGLQLSVKFELAGDVVLDPVALGPMSFPVRLKDCDEAQTLSISGELRLDEQSKINAILHRRDQAALELLVKQKTQSYFAEAISLQTFWSELNSGGVKQRLIDHLNGALRPLGRGIGYITLAREMAADNIKPFFRAADNVKPFFEDEILVECKIKDYPQTVLVENTVQMVLKDVAKYLAHGSPDLRDWNQKILQQVISERLLEKNCTELLSTLPQVEQNIKKFMDVEAEAIGYSFKQLITVPNLEALDWQEPFTLNVPGFFETKFIGFAVNLQIAVTACIPDFSGIASYVNRGKNVPALMKQAILEKTREFLHTVDPERFYIRFSFTEDNNEKTVEQELIEKISETLVTQFHAEIISVTPKMGDTEITEKLRVLQEKVCSLAVDVFLPDTDALVPVRFVGAFKVESVDAAGWHKFRQLKYNVDEITKYLETYISSELDEHLRRVRSGTEQYGDPEDLIKHLAQKCIREVYGLGISVSSVRRLHNELELAQNETQTRIYKRTLEAAEARVEALLSQLAIAEIVLLKLIEEGGTDMEIIKQKEKIALIRSELPSSPASSGKKLKSLSASRISGRASLSGPSETKRKRLAAGSQTQEEAKNEK
jgi:hypothetical protein